MPHLLTPNQPSQSKFVTGFWSDTPTNIAMKLFVTLSTLLAVSLAEDAKVVTALTQLPSPSCPCHLCRPHYPLWRQPAPRPGWVWKPELRLLQLELCQVRGRQHLRWHERWLLLRRCQWSPAAGGLSFLEDWIDSIKLVLYRALGELRKGPGVPRGKWPIKRPNTRGIPPVKTTLYHSERRHTKSDETTLTSFVSSPVFVSSPFFSNSLIFCLHVSVVTVIYLTIMHVAIMFVVERYDNIMFVEISCWDMIW